MQDKAAVGWEECILMSGHAYANEYEYMDSVKHIYSEGILQAGRYPGALMLRPHPKYRLSKTL